MGTFTLGSLRSVPVGGRPDLVSPEVAAALEALGLGEEVGVVEIDPELSDTAATQAAYDLPEDALANCVIVSGRREGEQRIAACLVLATTRADVNNTVKRRLDVRKASFLAREDAVTLTGMEFGAITPIGLPAGWPVFVDRAVLDAPLIVIGSGLRRTKLLLAGSSLTSIPGVEIIDGLGQPIAP
ncbi:hypothetical protein B7R54_13785 [Subtercola boreus]|uniref:YbaK/aminoacyl-tRNA synthetase-associated domain-containing protein n=1 Tax=Subtercola boreus TaxID=120213 RepID=A0A3E0VJM8_9MICO|nr:YbaK/EbsC family protein [Subtercola boreus]RFA10162.1 hypothetical protein B7R54_13785 [Subtercola boreus]